MVICLLVINGRDCVSWMPCTPERETSGLTPEELAEQKELYKEYLANIRSQLKAQLDNIEVVDELPDKKQLH